MSVAVVRPVTPWDIDQLAQSFAEWDDFLPCNVTSKTSAMVAGGSGERRHHVELFLVFSRKLDRNITAMMQSVLDNRINHSKDWKSSA